MEVDDGEGMSAGRMILRSRWEGRYSMGSSISGSESLTSSMRACDILAVVVVVVVVVRVWAV